MSKKHYYSAEGWGIFFSNQSSVNGEYVDQVQRIDELNKLKCDDEAAELARAKGFVIGTENNPYEVVSYPKENIMTVISEVEPIWSEIKSDYVDEETNETYIDAWVSPDDNEDGRTIAVIDNKTGIVTYHDERAETDVQAQEVINEVIQGLK